MVIVDVDFKFDHAEYLHLFWGVIALGLIFGYGFYRKNRALRLFATDNLFGQLMPDVSVAPAEGQGGYSSVSHCFFGDCGNRT